MRGLTTSIINEIKDLIRKYNCNNCNHSFGIIEGEPTLPPEKKDPKVLLDTETGNIWYWNEEEWKLLRVGNTYTVVHKDDETVPRPPDWNGVVMWVGDVEPVHAKNNDLWVYNGETTVIDRDTLVWTFDTTKAGSATDRIVLPMQNGQTYDFDVIYNGNVIKHINTYTDNVVVFSDGAGIKQITIRGIYSSFVFNNAGDKLKLKSIERWGKFRLDTNCFYGCENLTLLNVKGKPKLNDVLIGNFWFCKAITQIKNLNEWDISRVVSIQQTFIDCILFNQDLDKWDVSKVSIFNSVFNRCYAFNGNVTTWDVSNIKDFTNGFNSCSTFNQDISAWNLSKNEFYNNFLASCISFNQALSGWDMTKAVSLTSMFTNMNLNADVANWNITSRVNSVNNMFKNNTGFNRDITTWDTSGVIVFSGCFSGCTSFTGKVEMDMRKATSIVNFVLNTKIHTLILKNIKSGITVVSAFNVQLGYLQKVILEDIDVSFDIKSFNLGTVQSFIELCNGDGVYKGIKNLTSKPTKTVTLPNTPAGNDPDVVAAFAAKNWTVTY